MAAPNQSPVIALRGMINSVHLTQMIYVAAALNIADLVADQPHTPAELAEATGSHAPSLYRLLRALAGSGIFAEDEQGRFRLTPLAEPLRTGVPHSLHDDALWNGIPSNWQVWGDLLHAVQTGEDAHSHLIGMRSFEYRAQQPDLNALFNSVMTEVSHMESEAVAAAYDFSGLGVLIDVAGGYGSLLATLLKANPNLRGVLFEQAHVIAGARALLQAAGVARRCQALTGDMFEAIPGGADAYLFKHILHDWMDAEAVAILRNCRQAMKPGAKLLVIERIIPRGNEPNFGKLLDMIMLVAEGGLERTEAEYRALFDQSGFRLTNHTITQAGVSIIEGVPV